MSWRNCWLNQGGDHDETLLYLHRAAGYYVDVGASQMIIPMRPPLGTSYDYRGSQAHALSH